MRHILRIIFDGVDYWRYRDPVCSDPTRCVCVDLNDVGLYNRYFYVLVKFFSIARYHVCMPGGFGAFTQIKHGDGYLQLVNKEKLVCYNVHSECKFGIKLTDANVSSDYFSFMLNHAVDDAATYHIPMPMHPLMYSQDLWDVPVSCSVRKKSVFMIGNFDPKYYGKLADMPFGVVSRIELRDLLQKMGVLTSFATLLEFEAFIESPGDNQCILIDSCKFKIEPKYLRPVLGKFSFFLACPGILMPHSHNLIEALSVGTIPVIQKRYAELLHPELMHDINSIQFEGPGDLLSALEYAYSVPDGHLEYLRRNVLDYYERNATPSAVISRLAGHPETIYLQTEAPSVYRLLNVVARGLHSVDV